MDLMICSISYRKLRRIRRGTAVVSCSLMQDLIRTHVLILKYPTGIIIVDSNVTLIKLETFFNGGKDIEQQAKELTSVAHYRVMILPSIF